MSVQSEFFDALLAELKARGLSDEVAEENVSKFKSQLKERAENDDYIDDALSKIPPASIAENIYNMLRAETDEDAGAKSEVMVIDTESDTVETTIKEGKDAMSPLSDTDDEQAAEAPDAVDEAANETDTEQSEEAVDAAAKEQAEDPASEATEDTEANEEITDDADSDIDPDNVDTDFVDNLEEASPVSEAAAAEDDDFIYNDDVENISSFAEAETEEQSADAPAEAAENTADDDDDFSVYSPTSKHRINHTNKNSSSDNNGEKKPTRLSSETIDLFADEDESKNSWLFIVMAIFLIPLFCVLGAAAFVVILGLWVGLAVVIAVLLLALAAIVVAGTAYAVLGLIFGIIEAFSGNAAAALFEVGLALCVGGIVMFIGIWVYNFAIRFIPFIIKKLGVLLILIFKLFKNALIKLKALCRKI